jgi:cytochrome c oxidase cbb3-type subunit III
MRWPSAPGILLVLVLLCACNDLPGRPKPGAEAVRPEQVLSFDALYQENCAGCHGVEGENGPATNLANPEYQALIDDATLRDIIANGQKGTMMPGFAKSGGGTLTDQQVDVILQGMRSRWFQGDVFRGLNAPAYKANGTGNQNHGQQVYSNACARCHGALNGPPGQSGAILNGSFLALISNQAIRTTVIAGRPDLGMPDWRNQVKDHPLTNEDVADVVAWLIAQRPQTPGQPYPARSAEISKKTSGGT